MRINELEEIFIDVVLDRDFIYDIATEIRVSYYDFYRDVWGWIKLFQNEFREKTIVTTLNNSYLLCSMLFAAMFSGNVISPFDATKGKSEIGSLLAETSNSVLIDEDMLARENEAGDSFLKRASQLSDDFSFSKFCAVVRNASWQKPYLVTYTSGTSGKSKGVVHSAANLLYCAKAFINKMEIPSETIFLHIMPMSYMAGILNSLVLPFVAHAQLVLYKRFDVQSAMVFWDIVANNHIDRFWAAPAMLAMIMKLDRGNKGERYCREHAVEIYVGTAPLKAALRREFEKRYGVQLYQSYGLSETLFVSSVTKERHDLDTTDAGVLLDGVIIDFAEDGELLIKTPWMFLEYSNENTASYFVDGSYKSGDIGKYDQGLYITDRKKDLIIRGGINLSPHAMEEIILSDPLVEEAAVVACEDDILGESACCCLVMKNHDMGAGLEARLREAVVRKLGKAYIIDRFVMMAELPRNSNGKIDRKKIRGHLG